MSHHCAACASGTGSYYLSTTEEAAAEDQCLVREQDRLMPVANVTRIMKKILPPHAKISGDAKETIQECVSEYISFITSEANDRCQYEGRKTVTCVDVIWAMSKLGFDDYVEPLILYLHRYRELEEECSATRTDQKTRPPEEYGSPMGDMTTAGQMLHLAPPPHHPETEYLDQSAATATSVMMKTWFDAGSSFQQG